MSIFKSILYCAVGQAIFINCATAKPDVGWLCVADRATGFAFDKHTESWTNYLFSTADKFIVRKPNSQELEKFAVLDIFHNKRDKLTYVVSKIGDHYGTLWCMNADNLNLGTFSCNGSFYHFIMNTHLLRMTYTSDAGYVTQDQPGLKENPPEVFIEIGRCSVL